MAGSGGGGSGPYKKARIEIIPLIDVMFFLLASFMMVSLSMQKLQAIRMDLPSAVAQKTTVKPDMVEIAVTRAGDTVVDKQRLSLVELEQLLTKRWSANTNLPVYIKADQDVTHGRVMEVLDTVKHQGIIHVSFAIDPPKE